MTHVMLSPSYIPLILMFTISFSSTIVPFISQPTSLKLYDFLIYPSNDSFKNYILPFLSSEHLLTIYFNFRNLSSNVTIQKFLPLYSIVKTNVLDLKNSYFAYIFENEFSFFNPIIFDSEHNYSTVTLDHRGKNVTEDSIYALFSSSNKLFSLEAYDLPHNQEVFAAFWQIDETVHFLAVEKNAQGKLTAIADGIITNKLELADNLDCVLEAHKSKFKTFYFKIFDLYHKYTDYLFETRYVLFFIDFYFRDCPWTFLLAKKLYEVFRLAFLYFAYFPVYHAEFFPFYILSLPFEIILFQYDFFFSAEIIIAKHFVCLWTIPCFVFFTFYLSYFELHFAMCVFGDMQIRPQKIKWIVPYLLGKKHLHNTFFRQTWDKLVEFLIIFGLGFIYILPFFPFMMIKGEL